MIDPISKLFVVCFLCVRDAFAGFSQCSATFHKTFIIDLVSHPISQYSVVSNSMMIQKNSLHAHGALELEKFPLGPSELKGHCQSPQSSRIQPG